MAEIRVSQVPSHQAAPVHAEADGRGTHHEQQQPRHHEPQPGAEELALALSAPGRVAMRARYEEDATGAPAIRIVDAETGATVAVLSPEELRALAEQTGLPAGLLVRAIT